MTSDRAIAENRTSRLGWREVTRSYLLAGRIAAGIFQSQPEGRLPEAFALSRVHRASDLRRDRMERVGNVVITLPWEQSRSAESLQVHAGGGLVREDPFSLPALYRRR